MIEYSSAPLKKPTTPQTKRNDDIIKAKASKWYGISALKSFKDIFIKIY
jgi:hypothetical protein